MISIIILSQISIYALKNDFDILFEKRTKPLTKLEIIKDAYKINIYDTLYELQQHNLNATQAKDVIILGEQLIEKNWNEYIQTSNNKEFEPTFITYYIKKIFSFKKLSTDNNILKINIIRNVDNKIQQLNKDLQTIEELNNSNGKLSVELIDRIYSQINSINIYITNLINYDLNLAINEKRDTQKVFNVLTMILNFSIIFVFCSSIILSILLINNFKKLHIGLEDTVDEKTKELQKLNENLEKRVKYEVDSNRKKDLIMFQQARLASLGEMIANIAHQWRQPLGAILVIIQSFQLKAQMGKLDEEYIEKKAQDAMHLANNMSDTLEDFQNFFKPNKSKEIFSLKECINDSFDLSKYVLEQEKITFSLTLKEEISILGYYNELSHVFLNIISNSKDALSATKENNRQIKVIVKRINEKAKISIYDNGGGILPEVLPKIFEPYYTTKYKSNGTGIGLYMSKQIIEKHMRGSIKCKNVYYKIDKVFEDCTLFIIEIPIAQKETTNEK
ncbi:histidine kinase [Candidatus Marinarcus aquaticus]|uniref:histidine kinase n=2 Tax=Candidatus Marinarcus aquaticus TaxID=2044504 RepID=A0A4Q0XTS8_9BACT|nr:histidine kinase [Candidatus Marinarcus aquaticus]